MADIVSRTIRLEVEKVIFPWPLKLSPPRLKLRQTPTHYTLTVQENSEFRTILLQSQVYSIKHNSSYFSSINSEPLPNFDQDGSSQDANPFNWDANCHKHVDADELLAVSRSNLARPHNHFKNALATPYSSRYGCKEDIPKFNLSEDGIDAKAAYQLIHDELGNQISAWPLLYIFILSGGMQVANFAEFGPIRRNLEIMCAGSNAVSLQGILQNSPELHQPTRVMRRNVVYQSI